MITENPQDTENSQDNVCAEDTIALTPNSLSARRTPKVSEIRAPRFERAAGLLRKVHALGVEIGCKGQALTLRDTQRVLCPEQRQELIDARADLLLLLRCGPVRLLTEREFEVGGRVTPAWSDILGEEILIAADSASRYHPLLQWPDNRVVYRVSEVKRLQKTTPEFVRTLHAVKKAFGNDAKVIDWDREPPASGISSPEERK